MKIFFENRVSFRTFSMSKRFLLSMIFFGVFFSWTNMASALMKDYPCNTETSCKSVCTGGTYASITITTGLGGYEYYCNNGYASKTPSGGAANGNVASGGTCTNQTDCSSGLYCAYASINGWACKSKLADGAECGDQGLTLPGSNGNLCSSACSTGKSYLNSSNIYKCGTDPAAATPSVATPAAGGASEFANPLKFKTVEEVLQAALNNMQGILGVICIVFIVIGGIMYMLSAGDETMITRAKATIGGALIGLSIILAAPSFLKEIKTVLSGKSTGGALSVDKALTIQQIGINVLTFLLSIFGILAIIALVVGGIKYVTAYGDEEKIESGKKFITYALIGILIAVGALILVKQIAVLLGSK